MPYSGELYDEKKAKKYEHTDTYSEMGKSHFYATCPFCEEDFKVYIWSLCGGGKKCPKCGAMHVKSGVAWPVK